MPSLGKTKARGYGGTHKQLRKRWQRSVDAGIATCSRCGYPIEPGEKWDLDHDDLDRTRYLGPAHRACNRATAKPKRRRVQTSRRSRAW
jgi:hypothetical protein